MVFSSSVFMFAFVPAFLLLYIAVVKRSLRNVVLLLASLVFYAWGEPVYVFLMIASILVNWIFGLAIHVSSKTSMRRLFLILDLVFNLAVLGFFKYWGFIVENINAVLGEVYIEDPGISLPIGISFFTLQALSYVIDVYRDEVKAQKNPLYLGMYIAMFPQLVAGPIVRYSQIEEEIDNRHMTFQGFVQGLRLFTIGLGKKVLLANNAGALADSLLHQSAQNIGFVGCFSGVAAYTFQIYFDFSGYSDMAIGLGKMLGFNYARNFNYPYTSKSATEFWRRWHMSLGSFFRDYVYIPLGGSRVSTPRWMLNIFIVWGLTGIWHGAAWNFILWGLYWGVLLMIEKLFLLKLLKKSPKIIQHLYCVVLFFFGWLLFAVTGLDNVGQWVIGMFGGYGFTGTSNVWLLNSWSYIALIPIAVIGSLPWAPYLRKKLEVWVAGEDTSSIVAAPEKGNDFVPPCTIVYPERVLPRRKAVCEVILWLFDIALIVIFVVSCMSVASSSYNPFIYFQF